MGTDTAKEKQVTRPLKIHSEDWDMARDFNRAAYFTAHLRCGREFAMTIRDLPTYEAAQEAAHHDQEDLHLAAVDRLHDFTGRTRGAPAPRPRSGP